MAAGIIRFFSLIDSPESEIYTIRVCVLEGRDTYNLITQAIDIITVMVVKVSNL
jgi:hypothetical protein